MAFEQLEKFVDCMAAEYKRHENIVFIIVLADYHSTVLSHAKFKSQKMYCEKVIHELNPSFFKGYFKREKP